MKPIEKSFGTRNVSEITYNLEYERYYVAFVGIQKNVGITKGQLDFLFPTYRSGMNRLQLTAFSADIVEQTTIVGVEYTAGKRTWKAGYNNETGLIYDGKKDGETLKEMRLKKATSFTELDMIRLNAYAQIEAKQTFVSEVESIEELIG